MSDYAWVAWYWGDYIGKTTGLSLVEHGIYCLLLANYYLNGGPLVADRTRLARMCGVHTGAEYKALDAILTQFFDLDETNATGVFRHQRADEELAKRNEISAKRRGAAYKRYANAPANAVQMHTQSQSQSQEPTPGAAEEPPVLPEWLPLLQWNAFLKMRNRMRRPLTHYAEKLIIRKLEKLRDSGQDVEAVLDQSVSSGWQGVFEVDSNFREKKKPVPMFDALKAFREAK